MPESKRISDFANCKYVTLKLRYFQVYNFTQFTCDELQNGGRFFQFWLQNRAVLNTMLAR